MKKLIVWCGIAAMMALPLSAPLAKRAKPKKGTVLNAFLQKGEYLRFRAKIGQVDGGYAYLLLKKVKRATEGYMVRAVMKARTNSFFDKIHRVNNRFESLFSLFSSKNSFNYKMDVDQAGNVQRRKLTLDPSRPSTRSGKIPLTLSVRPKKKTKRKFRPWKRKFRVPKGTRDLVGAFYHARTLPFEKGHTFQMYVFVTGRLWKVKGKMIGRRKIYTTLGYRKTYLVKAKTWCLHRPGPAQYVRVWISDDKYRVPLKIDGMLPYIGRATAELVGYRRNKKSPYLDAKRGSGRLRRFFSNF